MLRTDSVYNCRGPLMSSRTITIQITCYEDLLDHKIRCIVNEQYNTILDVRFGSSQQSDQAAYTDLAIYDTSPLKLLLQFCGQTHLNGGLMPDNQQAELTRMRDVHNKELKSQW